MSASHDSFEIRGEEIVRGELIGGGDFAKVYEGTCRGLRVAVKVFKKQSISPNSPFIRELEMLTYVYFAGRSYHLLLSLTGFVVNSITQTFVYSSACAMPMVICQSVRIMLTRTLQRNSV